jgi:hypothetical protein
MQENLLSGEYSYDSVTIVNMDGANIIITSGVFGTGESRRIVFRILDVEKGLILSESCLPLVQNNTELINNVEALSQRINNNLSKGIRNDAAIVVVKAGFFLKREKRRAWKPCRKHGGIKPRNTLYRRLAAPYTGYARAKGACRRRWKARSRGDTGRASKRCLSRVEPKRGRRRACRKRSP